LQNESISIFDPVINKKHLVNCLTSLLGLYGRNNYENPSREQFEALNCLISLDSYNAISRAYTGFKHPSYVKYDLTIDSTENIKRFWLIIIDAFNFQEQWLTD